MRILILCTGNSCRSQMAEGFLKSFDARLEVFSAGTHPAAVPNPNAVAVMKEVGIDISWNKPKNVDIFLAETFDYVITVCGGAKEICPAFTGTVKHRLHIGFDDPADAIGTREEVLLVYRRVRDEIKEGFSKFYLEIKTEIDMEATGLQESSKMQDVENDKACCCDGDCCPPKKKSVWPKILFTVVILAAIGIVVAKLFFANPQSPSTKQGCGSDSSAVTDSSSSKSCCDTTKNSSCCPK